MDGKSGLERANTKALGPIMFQLIEKGYDKDDSALTLEHPERWSDKAKDFLRRTVTASPKDLSSVSSDKQQHDFLKRLVHRGHLAWLVLFAIQTTSVLCRAGVI